MAARKPKPRIGHEVCDLCGLDWHLHGDEPTTETCIRLLAAEVRRLASALAARPLTYPVPYPAPYPVPYRPWHPYPFWQPFAPTITWNQTSAVSGHSPMLSNVTPRAIAMSSSC